MVGPFAFFDHMGPAEFLPGEGIGVRPHSHIGLATITYLFEGEIMHRDSLVRVIMGEAYGHTSPVKTYSTTLYLEVQLVAATTLSLPDHYQELAVYVISGELQIDGENYELGIKAIAADGHAVSVLANQDCRFMVVGGDPLGHRTVWWNFVSSSKERIEQAKCDWKEGRFESVPGDKEFIPLPE